MEIITNFIINNSTLFIVITAILVFALIGYFVDQNEQKKGISTIIKPKEKELNIKELSSKAQHKSLSSALTDNLNNQNKVSNENANQEQSQMPNQNNGMNGQPVNNTITDINSGSNSEIIGFNVFKK